MAENLCVKLVFFNPGNGVGHKRTILYGIILSETSDFIEFKTSRRFYTIAKKLVLVQESTDKPFVEELP